MWDVIRQRLQGSEASGARNECGGAASHSPAIPAQCTARDLHTVAELAEPYNTMTTTRESSPPISTVVQMAVNLGTVHILPKKQYGVPDH
jgi:hypothetical protein